MVDMITSKTIHLSKHNQKKILKIFKESVKKQYTTAAKTWHLEDWIVGKNKNSHMRLQQKTQNHTHQTIEKHKIVHQKTKNHIPSYKKNYRIAHAKAQNCKPDCNKK